MSVEIRVCLTTMGFYLGWVVFPGLWLAKGLGLVVRYVCASCSEYLPKTEYHWCLHRENNFWKQLEQWAVVFPCAVTDNSFWSLDTLDLSFQWYHHDLSVPGSVLFIFRPSAAKPVRHYIWSPVHVVVYPLPLPQTPLTWRVLRCHVVASRDGDGARPLCFVFYLLRLLHVLLFSCQLLRSYGSFRLRIQTRSSARTQGYLCLCVFIKWKRAGKA